MILKRLKLENFRSFAHADLVLSEQQNYVVGNNWQGKSSLVEAIAFALFGADAFPRRVAGSAVRAEHLVSDGAQRGAVELMFVVGDDEYAIKRGLPRSTVTLHCDGKPIASGKRPVEEKLADLLAVDAKFFSNVFYADQDELRKALDASPADRQLFIERLIGQETWRERIDALRKAERRLREFVQDLATGRFGVFVRELDELGDESREAGEELKKLEREIASLERIAPRSRQELRVQKSRAEEELARLQHEETALRGEHVFVERLVAALKKGSCPTCSQPVQPRLRKSRLAALGRQLREQESELKALRRRLSRMHERFEASDFEGAEENLTHLRVLRERSEVLTREQTRRTEREKRLRADSRVFGKKPEQHRRALAEIAFLRRLGEIIDTHRAELRGRIVTELVVAMNDLLSRFHDGDFDANAIIGSEMDLRVRLHDREVPLTNLSGAAKDLFAIALRYGLMRIAARKIDFLVLDEPTRHMDAANVRQLRSVFDELRDRQLVVVTVQPEFSDARGKHFTVRKDEQLRSVIA